MEFEKIDYKDIGMRIRKERTQRKMSQQTLAELSDLQPNSISHMENGSTNISLQSLLHISTALNAPIENLLCGVAPTSQETYLRLFDTILEDCDDDEIRTLLDICEAAKVAIRRNVTKTIYLK